MGLNGSSSGARNGAPTVSPSGGGYVPPQSSPSLSGNWYATDSYINTKVATNPTLDSNSATWITTLSNNGATSIFGNGTSSVNGDGSATVYQTDGSQTLRTISLVVSYNGSSTIQVPIASTWKATPTDGHMVVIDTRDNNYWEFQGLNTTNWTATGVARALSGYTLLTDSGIRFGSNDHISGLPTPLGLIRPSEITNGVIPHGLRFACYCTSNQFRSPAWGTDGSHNPGIPMGAHLWLPRSVSLSSFGLNSYQTIVATALQEYGMWLGDTSGGCAIYFESTLDGSSFPFSSLTLPNALIRQMVVLAAGQ